MHYLCISSLCVTYSLKIWQKKILEHIQKHGDVTPDAIVSLMNGNETSLRPDNGIDFVEFAKQRFIERYNSDKIGVNYSIQVSVDYCQNITTSLPI